MEFILNLLVTVAFIAPALIAEEKHIDEMLQKIKEVVVKY